MIELIILIRYSSSPANTNEICPPSESVSHYEGSFTHNSTLLFQAQGEMQVHEAENILKPLVFNPPRFTSL
jgi:hypothetical protein